MSMTIHKASISDADRLTKIAFDAKRTWKYPESYMQTWEDELTITPNYIQNNWVWVAELQTKIVGFVSLVEVTKTASFGEVKVNKGWWMDHMFVSPDAQKKGIGCKLWAMAIDHLRDEGVSSFSIFVDPNATGFYDKMGARFVQNSPSSIAGRKIPVYNFRIS